MSPLLPTEEALSDLGSVILLSSLRGCLVHGKCINQSESTIVLVTNKSSETPEIEGLSKLYSNHPFSPKSLDMTEINY